VDEAKVFTEIIFCVLPLLSPFLCSIQFYLLITLTNILWFKFIVISPSNLLMSYHMSQAYDLPLVALQSQDNSY